MLADQIVDSGILRRSWQMMERTVMRLVVVRNWLSSLPQSQLYLNWYHDKLVLGADSYKVKREFV